MKLLVSILIMVCLTDQISSLTVEKFLNMSYEAGEAMGNESLQQIDGDGLKRLSGDKSLSKWEFIGYPRMYPILKTEFLRNSENGNSSEFRDNKGVAFCLKTR